MLKVDEKDQKDCADPVLNLPAQPFVRSGAALKSEGHAEKAHTAIDAKTDFPQQTTMAFRDANIAMEDLKIQFATQQNQPSIHG